MLLSGIHSPANPIQGSAFSTYGYKPSGNVLTLSVGDLASTPDEYVTKLPDGSMPTISISGNVLTFSHPQTHPYIGVGDYISWGALPSERVYISKKNSTRQWEIKTADGDSYGALSETSLISIDKTFSTLSDAINGAASGALALFGSNDLVVKSTTLQIACYAKASNNSNKIDIVGWNASQSNHIRIFVPRDIKTECNQINSFELLSNGPTTLIEMSNDYVIIDALTIEEDAACTKGIDIQGNGIVTNCFVKGFSDFGIFAGYTTPEIVIARNKLYGTSGVGIQAGLICKVINNSVDGYPTSYNFVSPTTNAYCANCLSANSTPTQGFVNPPAAFYNSASDDATATGTDCITSADIQFYDSANGDFRLTNANDNAVLHTGLDLSTYSYFPITVDADNNPIDNTPSIGALHMVCEVPCAIGDTSTDIKVAANISISNGVVTFSAGQTNDLLSVGDILQPGDIILTEKIDTTHWRATLASGLAPADDTGPTAVTSIKPQYESVAAYIADAGSVKDLVTADIALKLVCVEKTGTSDTAVNFTGFVSDETRSISVYTPFNTTTECNTRRRHLGIWNDSLVYISGITVDQTGGKVSITGVQLDDDVVSENPSIVIQSCVLKECGIQVKPQADLSASIAILNNAVYDGSGIEIINENTNEAGYEFAVYNNTVYNCQYGIKFNSHGTVNTSLVNNVRLINNLLIENDVDLFCDDPRSDNISSESNWTSDTTGLTLKLDYNNDIADSVSFIGARNFHIPLFQHLAMSYAYNAGADHFYQNYLDIDSETRPTELKWSIGADQYSVPSKKIAFFSVGHSTSDLQNDPGMPITVVGSIATFDDDLADSIGIGDKVTFQAAHDPVYLAEKGTSAIWRVVDNEGAAVSDFTNTIDKIERVSNSLDSALSADINAEFVGVDLTAKSAEIRIECYQDDAFADVNQVSISGWTTSSEYCMTIEAPYNILSQCNSRQRHEGVWDSDYYRLETTADSILLSNQYVAIDGLQIDSDNNKGCVFSTAEGSAVKRCIIKNISNGIEQDASAYSVYIQANIIYSLSGYGVIIKKGYCNNNTVIAPSTKIAYVSLVTATLINNIAQGIGTGYSGAGTKTSCISADASGTKTGVTLSFSGTDNYHLSRDDFEALNYGSSSAYNPEYDIDSELIVEYSIGADCKNLTTASQTFSCGRSTSNLVLPLTGLRVTIIGGVATFSMNAIKNYQLVTGDTLTYDLDNKIAYLNKKISDSSWSVVTHVGEIPTSASSVLVISIKRTFNYIENVFDVSSPNGLAQFSPYGDVTNPFTDLAKAKLQINIALDGMYMNQEPVAITGFTADENNYLRLYAPSAANESYTRQKHSGVYAITYSSIEYSSTTPSTGVIAVDVDYTRVDGIIVKSDGTIPCISVNKLYCQIVNNIVFGGTKGIDAAGVQKDSIIANNIVYDNTVANIATSVKDYLYNNTIVNGPVGVTNTALSISKNNVVRCTTCYSLSTANITYCMVTDTSIPLGNGNIRSPIITFKNYSGKDFNLNKTDQRGKGVSLNADSIYPFDTDAADYTRGRFWDMGALEYRVSKVVWYSIGDTAQNYLTGSAQTNDVTGGIVEFKIPQTSDKMISGDVLMSGSTVVGYLAEKVDATHWYVVNEKGVPLTAPNLNITAIKRRFASLQYCFASGINSFLVTHDLVFDEYQVNITVSNDACAASSAPCQVSGWYSDCDYFIRIFSPIDTAKHCNKRHRHYGKIGSGAQLTTTSPNYALYILQTNYCEVSGLIINDSYASAKAIYIQSSLYFLVESNIIRGCDGGGIYVSADYGASILAINLIINNIINNCRGFGICATGDNVNFIWIINNTIVNCEKGIYHIKGRSTCAILYVYNNICQDNTYADFVEDYISNTGKFNLYYNISKDATAGVLNNNFNNSPIQFVDKSLENYAPDRLIDSKAINSALDMQTVSPCYFFEDCRGVDRENGAWDRGAIEQNEVIGSGVMYIGPVLMSNQFGYVTGDFPDQIVYLRDNFYDNISTDIQFNSILDLNTYLIDNDIDNIIVYVEGGCSFGTDAFSLNDRGDRTVRIMTDPSELEEGTASIIYPTAGLINDASKQGCVYFENIKVYSDDSGTADYLISSTALTTKMIFINCVVQVNKDALTNCSTCQAEMINSILIYSNGGGALTVYLVKNSLTGHKNYNNILLIDSASDKTFQMCSGVLSDYIENVITYNVGGGSFDIYAPGRVNECLENSNPEFIEIESFISPSVIMTSNFKTEITSPAINNGDDVVVALYGIETDIVGNDRQFFGGVIDIGPYETHVLICDLYSYDIKSIDQVKIDIDRVNKRLVSLDNNKVYDDLYASFQYDQEDMEDFVRDRKIVITLKKEPSLILKSDKEYTVIDEFEAYYDTKTTTIIMTKRSGESPTLVGKLLESDAYFLRFNEQERKLYLLLNEAVTMCISGSENPIQNVRFGGNPIFNS